MTKKQCPLGEDCDLTTAWMLGRQSEKAEAAARIEELEANLGKTTKLLERIERRLSGISGFFFDTFPRKEIRSLLEELKGQDDE
jgi:uncharacterized protein YlaN (UPF0358 family)